MTEVSYPNVWGETREQARARRRAQGHIVHALQLDLYERIPTPGDPDGMTWRSPLGTSVRVSAPGPRGEIRGSDGQLLHDFIDYDGFTTAGALP